MKAQNGSFLDTQASEPSMQDARSDKSQAPVKPVDLFVNGERDLRSFVLKEYDAHQ